MKQRISDASEKLQQLEETKSRLLFEASVLVKEKDSLERSFEKLCESKQDLEDQLSNALETITAFQAKASEVDGDWKRSEGVWKERVDLLEKNDRRSRRRIAELESMVCLVVCFICNV